MFANDLQVGMAVANMPSYAKHVGGASAFDFDQRLRRTPHFNNSAIIEDETIAVA